MEHSLMKVLISMFVRKKIINRVHGLMELKHQKEELILLIVNS
jgi:hypothetical protein